ncbi:histidinol-phosphate transaminase [Methyloversatilis thermotolerans]|uniref:histidinol-phosphate transaminase n=1 Tax=Methyloversatilis thermotolerans TaxID=1346290 RepID=UPI000360AFCA|nr:histidinol-phosphate transaminase [Methyloversatilis thermotolerans]
MSIFWSPVVHALSPYTPGEQPKLDGLIKLNTNENPYPPSPHAVAAIQAELGEDGDRLKLYPEPTGLMLREALADHFGIDSTNVFVGNSSDEVLAHTFIGLLKHDRPLLFPDITYSFYPVYCGLYGIDYRQIALDERFAIRVDDYIEARPGAVIFPNPNAPTGRLLPLTDISRLASALPDSPVVIDEAYIDFGGESAVALIAEHANLLVTQTLSKSRSLAGLRVGFAIGQPHLIDALTRVKDSFNSYPLDRLALVGATAAVRDREWFDQTRRRVAASRDRLSEELESLGFEVLPSAANFLFVRHPQHDAAQLAAALREQRILVRHFKAARIDQFLRITVGTTAQCNALVDALQSLV